MTDVPDGAKARLHLHMPCLKVTPIGTDAQKVNLIDAVTYATNGKEPLAIQPFVNK